jgi:hypothetical protein
VEKKPTRKVARPRQEKIWLAVHRSDNAVYYKRLEPAGYALLAQLRDGASLQVACENSILEYTGAEEFSAKLREWFTQWASFGWFCGRDET